MSAWKPAILEVFLWFSLVVLNRFLDSIGCGHTFPIHNSQSTYHLVLNNLCSWKTVLSNTRSIVCIHSSPLASFTVNSLYWILFILIPPLASYLSIGLLRLSFNSSALLCNVYGCILFACYSLSVCSLSNIITDTISHIWRVNQFFSVHLCVCCLTCV